MSSDSFVHLHVHTEYSMLDGAARLKDLFATAAELGMTALATTDHGYLYGAYDFYKTAKQYGIKPIIGVEGYYAPQGRLDRSPFQFGAAVDEQGNEGEGGDSFAKGKAPYTHMTMLSENTEGMHNLFRLSSLASLEGHYYKPRFDRELLQTYGKGLIGTTGCPSGTARRSFQLLLRQAPSPAPVVYWTERSPRGHSHPHCRRRRPDRQPLASFWLIC